MKANPIRSFMDLLAKMGLSIRDDPPKVIELEGREWGPEIDGFRLSVAVQPAVVSVVLRNVGRVSRTLEAPDFVNWFQLEVTAAERTPFGNQVLRTAGGQRTMRILELASGQAVEAEIPIDAIFHLTAGPVYRVRASCAISPDIIVVSNYSSRSFW